MFRDRAMNDQEATDRLTAILALGLKQIKPQISKVSSSSAAGGSYLQVSTSIASFRVPILDNSSTRRTYTRFR